MINIIHNKNIFTSDADILVNPVNTVGVMGAGLAKQFKIKFPRYFICKEIKMILKHKKNN